MNLDKSMIAELTNLLEAGNIEKLLDYVDDLIEGAYNNGYADGVADTEE